MMDPSSLDQTLHKYKIELPEKQSALLERYCNQLWQWNEKINLTRHLDFERFVARDVTDSLALADIIEPDEEILDVGTGGGVPGIVVAILRPDVQVTLCESVKKKQMPWTPLSRVLVYQLQPIMPAQRIFSRTFVTILWLPERLGQWPRYYSGLNPIGHL